MKGKIKEWASSLSGCDGGNIKADTWLCGIEWGGGSVEGYYETQLRQEIEKGAGPVNLKSFDWNDSLTYKYGLSFAKLYTAINGEEVEDYAKVTELTGCELFKLNLYPIAFDSTDHDLWHKNKLDEITGFKSKLIFNTWCLFNRFPAFAKLRKEHKPKLIIGTGVDYLRDFLMFFGAAECVSNLHSGKIEADSEANKYDRTFYWVHLDGGTLLVVIPFFSGRYGLNSNVLLQKMGERISELMKGPKHE